MDRGIRSWSKDADQQDYWFEGREPVAYEVVPETDGSVRLVELTAGVIRRATPQDFVDGREVEFVQVIDSKVVQTFARGEIVLGLPRQRPGIQVAVKLELNGKKFSSLFRLTDTAAAIRGSTEQQINSEAVRILLVKMVEEGHLNPGTLGLLLDRP